jgi:hypothetical protein
MSDRPVAVDDGVTATNDNLPLPLVVYPSHYGIFMGFKANQDGAIHFCVCARDAIANYILAEHSNFQRSERKEASNETILNGDFPSETIRFVQSKGVNEPRRITDVLNFETGLWHKCNLVVPEKRYSHEMYATVFQQNYGWYVKQQKLAYGLHSRIFEPTNISFDLLDSLPEDVIDSVDVSSKGELETKLARFYELYETGAVNGRPTTPTEDRYQNLSDTEQAEYDELQALMSEIQNHISEAAENEVRRAVDHYEKGNRWTNETILYQLIEAEYGDEYRLKRHHRPDWLNGMELDVYLVESKIGVEYQGVQHYEPVDHRGGEEALKERQERDQKTREL